MKTPLGKIVAASILFAGLVFIVMAAGSIYSIRQLSVAADWVDHTEEVKTQLNRVQVLLVNMESGARNYVITGQEDFLVGHNAAKEQIGPDLEKLRLQVADNAEQTQNWRRLKSLVAQRMESSTAIVTARRQQGFAAAAALVTANDTRQVSQNIRDLIAAMLTTEDELLLQRRTDSDWEATQSIIAAIATSLVGLAVMGGTGWVIVRQFRARRQAEDSLAKSRAELQGIVDNAPLGIFLKNLEGRYLLVNQPMKNVLGLDPAACLGQTPAQLFPAARADMIQREDGAVLAGGQPQENDMEALCHDGVRRTFRTIKFPLRDAAGRIYAVGGISSDITERKRMESQLHAALDSAETASRTKSQFLTNMSHELRTPLNSIIGFSEILTDKLFGPMNEKQQQYVNNILSSGRHLLLLINDLLDLAKIEAGKVQLDLERVAVAGLVREGANLAHGSAMRKGVTLELAPVDAGLVAQLDPARTKQIIYNLLSNAVKFTPKGGRVTIMAEGVAQPVSPARGGPRGFAPGTALPGEWLRVTVADSGMGIAPENLERIFEEFEQLDSTYARQQEGTGLGLALTRKLAHLHDGCVWAESPGCVNRGSTFVVLLPLAGPAQEAESASKPAAKRAAPVMETPREALSGNARPLILVVEDDPQSSHLMNEHLTFGGYDVAHARTGEEALRLAANLRPAAITLDIVLPDANGMDVLSRLKATQATSGIPVVIVSVTDDRQLGLSLGAAEFFVKPVSAEKLLEALARAGAASQKKIHEVLVVDDEAAARESVAAVLEPRGYKVRAAVSGADALRLIAQHPPDVAIVDLTMPGMSGFELVRQLRQNPATCHLPICIYTAKDLSASEVHWLSERATAITAKPFREQLLTELERVGANST